MSYTTPTGLVALAVIATGCGDADFAPYNRLDRLRVLAIQSEPAVIAPGQSATLTPLVYAPEGETPTHRWSWCPFTLPRETGFACAVTHDELQAAADDAAGPGVVTVPSFDLGTETTATLSALADPSLLRALCAEVARRATATSAVPDCEASFEVTVRLETRTATELVETIKRVPLAFDADDADNVNPILGTLRTAPGEEADEADAVDVPLDGSGSLRAGTAHSLWVDVPAASLQSFVPSPDPAFPDEAPSAKRETHYLTWFITTGETDTERTSFIDGEVDVEILRTNVWTLPARVPGQRASVFLVLRDERGGVTWSRYDVTTPEP